MTEAGLWTDHGPNCSAGPNSADSHYEPTPETSRTIRQGDFVLIDIWAKLASDPNSIWYDITWTAVVGREPTAREHLVFNTVRDARDAAIATIQRAYADGRPIAGWEADDAARSVIREAGFAPFFTHRTGHNIAVLLHGNGAHLDNLETHDERLLLPHTAFSVEPGIYFPGEFGIRSEINMITRPGSAIVTGPVANRVAPHLTLIESSTMATSTQQQQIAQRLPGEKSSLPAFALLLGWLIPGAGHFLLGKWVRGLLLFVSILGMYLIGLGLAGKVYTPNTGDVLDILNFAGQLGMGLLYAIARIFSLGQPSVVNTLADYGTKFLVVAGLLNVIAAIDAHSLANGRKAS